MLNCPQVVGQGFSPACRPKGLPYKDKHLRDERGFSALEVVAVLGIIATLIAIVVPNVSAFMRESKVTRAEVDLRSIGQALMRFKQDLGRWPIFTDPEESASGGPDVRVLVGPGENPEPGDSGWILPMMGGVRDASNQVDTLEGQLVKNLSRYPTSFVALPWQGPYLQGPKEDPWNHSYLVNVEFLWSANFHSTRSVMVLSAGPNGRVETPFDTPTGSALGDDIVYKIK